jgi:hypothetical protein
VTVEPSPLSRYWPPVEPVEPITEARVRASVDIVRSRLADAAEQIVWQIEHRAWTVLGYRSWSEMRDAEYGDVAVMVPRALRPDLVIRMRQVGLTQAEIGTTLGVSRPTVAADLNADSDVQPPTIVTARGQTRPTSYERNPRSKPWPDQWWATVDKLNKVMDRVVRLAGDDRFDQHRESVGITGVRLWEIAETLTDLADRLRTDDGDATGDTGADDTG